MLAQLKALVTALWLDAHNLSGLERELALNLLWGGIAVLLCSSLSALLLFFKPRLAAFFRFCTFFICSILFAILITLPLPPAFPFQFTNPFSGSLIKADIFHVGLVSCIALTIENAIKTTMGYQNKELRFYRQSHKKQRAEYR